jgi:hypothetical protein
VVWNVAGNDRAWSALDRLQADICLLNEAIVPSDRRGAWSAIGTRGRDGKVRRWTTAVVSTWPSNPITDARPQWRQSKREVPFECSRPGSWAAAIVDTPLGRVSAVSLYGLLDELSDASVHRSLSEVSPVVDDPRYNKLVLLGGDLNTGTQGTEQDARFNDRERNVLERITALGLVDCVAAKRPPGRLEGCKCLHGDRCVETADTRTFRTKLTISSPQRGWLRH